MTYDFLAQIILCKFAVGNAMREKTELSFINNRKDRYYGLHRDYDYRVWHSR